MSYVPANENRDLLLFVGLLAAVGGLVAFLLPRRGHDLTDDGDPALSAEARMLEPDPQVDAREYEDLSAAEPAPGW
jgi:hypothetical protein